MNLKLLLLPVVFISMHVSANSDKENRTPVFSKPQMHKIVEIEGKKLRAIFKTPIEEISVYSMQNGKFEPIPFQIEGFGPSSFSLKKLITREKNSARFFDSDDLLVFMFKDSGEKVDEAKLRNIDIISTIKLADGGVETFIYLVRGGEKSEKRYVFYDENTGIISMPEATIQMNPNDLLDWGDFIPKHENEMEDKSILDCLKIRINGRFLAFRLALNNNNLKAKLKEIHQGPVRITLIGQLQAIVAKIPIIRAEAQMYIDSSSARLYIDIDTPEEFSKMVKDPVILVGVDGNNLYGQSVMTSVSGEVKYTVNGKMEDDEKSLNKMSVREPVSWIWLSDQDDLNLIGQYDLSINKNFDPDDYPDITIYYLDDKEKIDKPERFKGSLPTLGYRLEGTPKTKNIRMNYKVLIVKEIQPMLAGEFLEALSRDVDITVIKENK